MALYVIKFYFVSDESPQWAAAASATEVEKVQRHGVWNDILPMCSRTAEEGLHRRGLYSQ